MKRAESIRKSLVAAAVALALSSLDARSQALPAGALPTGGRVAGGQATISQSGAVMTIQQATARAALDWQSFNIGVNASVIFNQPSASSIALNRVLGGDPSQIFGRLSSNGQVFLTNPSGILFGRGAQVDVGGILASTLSMSVDDFMSGRYLLRGDGGSASIVNQGSLRALPKGYVALISPNVQNEGTIEATRGTAALVAANAATVDFMADGLIRIRVDEGALSAEIANKGAIRASGGEVLLTASGLGALGRAVVNNAGVIEARTFENVNGVIRLGGDDVTVAGRLDAGSDTGRGGSIKVMGDRVAVTGNARLDASGDLGGGEILVGGNYQGKGPEQNASRTYIGPDVRISADATTTGDGGRIIVWSNDTTQFYGSISARGGMQSGNGGLVETSGHLLDATGSVNASAPHGNSGLWLLDPFNLTISNNANSNVSAFTATGNSSNLDAATIQSTLNLGTDVLVSTGSGGVQSGQIVVNGTADSGGAVDINKTTGASAKLTLQATSTIEMHAGSKFRSTAAGNALDVTLNARNDNGSDGATGNVTLTGATITTNGGSLIIGGGTNPLTGKAIGTGAGNEWGVKIDGSTITTGAGSITINGQGSTYSGGFNTGVLISNGSEVSGNGGITIAGVGGGTVGSSVNHGVWIDGSSTYVETSGTGGITINGGAGNGVDSNLGIYLSGAAHIRSTTSGTGTIQLATTTPGTISGLGNAGIALVGGSVIESQKVSGGSQIELTGTGGGGTSDNIGVQVTGATVTSASGKITIDGAGNGSTTNNYGFALQSGGAVNSTFGAAIAVKADTMDLSGGTVQTGGTATLQTKTAGRSLIVESSPTAGVLSFTPGQLANVQANALELVTSGTGDITVASNNSILNTTGSPRTLYMLAGRNIVLQSDASLSGNATSPFTVVLNSNRSDTTGYISLGNNASIKSFGGTIDLVGGSTGVGSAKGDASNGIGVDINGATIDATGPSGGSTITIRGIGGSNGSGDNYGVAIRRATAASLVTTDGNGTIQIFGTGGTTGDNNVGVGFSDGLGAPHSLITATNGTITLTGTGGGTGTNSYGVLVGSSNSIASTGSGGVTLTGIGANGSGNDIGVYLSGGIVASATGPINVTGTGGGTVSNSYGVLIDDGGFVPGTIGSAGSAPISITGVAGGGVAGIRTAASSATNVIGGASASGDISLITDWLDLTGSLSVDTSGRVTIKPASGLTQITLGGSDSSGVLGISQAEIDTITTRGGALQIGDITGGWALNVAGVTRNTANKDTLSLVTNGALIQTGALNVSKLRAEAASITLNLSSNDVSTFAASAFGDISYVDANSFTVGSVDGRTGISASSGGSVNLTAGGSITVQDATVSSNGTMDVTAASNLNIVASGAASALNATGFQTIAANGIFLQGATSGSSRSASINGNAGQDIEAGAGGITLTGGEGTNNRATINQNGAASTQTISVTGTGTITLTGGGAGNGTGNNANINQSGSALQHVSAYGVQIMAGGGTTGGTSGAAIQTNTGSTASQQVDVGAGGINMHGGMGELGNNKAGIYLLADLNQPTFATVATQVINVTGGGGISITGGDNAATAAVGSKNVASIYADAHGAGASQTITVTGTGNVTLHGGATGTSNHAGIESNTPAQSVTVGSGGIYLYGGGATGNQARILEQLTAVGVTPVASTQSITVNNGGAISIQGGTGTGGGNVAQIVNNASGAQAITFMNPGSAISILGGTGSILSNAGNSALIDAVLGSQLITGSVLANDPAITVTGGPSGGNTGAGATSLGHSALIRARVGTQTIDAGAIQVIGGASGVDNSATIQAPIQVIGAASVSIQGGGSGGTAGGARIGGIGGGTPGPTDLSLTTTGDVTITGGSVSRAGIGTNTTVTPDTTTDITIVSTGGNITVDDGTGAGAGIGQQQPTLRAGDISLTAAGDIALGATNGFGSMIRTGGNVTLTAGGNITEAANSKIVGNILTATTLNNAGGAISLPGLNNDVATIDLAARNAVNSADAPGAIIYRDAGGFDVLWARTASTVDLTAGADITIPVGQSIVAPDGVTLTADNMELLGTINAGSALAKLQTLTAGRHLYIEAIPTASVLSFTPTQLSNIQAGTLELATNGNGDINITAGFTASAGTGISLTSGRDVNVTDGYASTTGNIDVNATRHLNVTASSTATYLEAGNVTVNAGGDVTLQGGAGAGAYALVGTLSGSAATVTIHSQQGITLNKGSGTGADAMIGSQFGGFGDIDLRSGLGGSTGSIVLNAGIVKTEGYVYLDASMAPGGQITQAASGVIHASTLETSSDAGTTLIGANTVSAFSAFNQSSGPITLNNTADPLVITGINQQADGPVTITNTGSISISSATIYARGDLTLYATGGGDQNISTEEAEFILLGDPGTTVKLQADNNIYFGTDSYITSDPGNQTHVVLNSDRDGTGSGAIWIESATIDTFGGSITLGGGANPALSPARGNSAFGQGVRIDGGASLYSAAGSIVMRGTGDNTYSGVQIDNASVVASGGTIHIEGDGSAVGGHGVLADNNANIRTEGAGNLTIIGRSYASSNGINIANSAVVESQGSGGIILTGDASAGAHYYGVFLESNALISTTASGPIQIQGTSGTGTSAIGVAVLDANISSVGDSSATIDITGIAGNPLTTQRGVFIRASGADAKVSSTDGNISIHGTGGTGADSQGVLMMTDNGLTAAVESLGTAGITIAGSTGNASSPSVQVTQYSASGVTSIGGPIAQGNILIEGTGGTSSLSLGGGTIQTIGNLTLSADSLIIANAPDSIAGDVVTVRPYSLNRSVEIGTSPAGSTLGITPTMLQTLNATSKLVIGRSDATAGSLTLLTPLVSDDVTAPALELAHKDIYLNASIDFSTPPRNLILTPGAAGAVHIEGGVVINVSGGTVTATGGSGTVNVTEGTVAITADTFNVGTLSIAGETDVSVYGTTNVGNLTLDGSSLLGSGDISVTGTFDWRGNIGVTSGTPALTTSGTTNITGAILDGRQWQNSGTVNHNSGQLELAGGASVQNLSAGIYNLATDSTESILGTGAFVNQGTLSQTYSGLNIIRSGVAFSNVTGATTNVLGGTLTVENFNANTNDGTIHIGAGKTFSTDNNALLNNGVVSGAGTLDLGGNIFTNEGIVRPGGAGTVGTLTVNGDFVQPTGTLEVDLDSSSSYDVLAVSGTANLSGTLNVNYLGGYNGAGGSHPVLTYSSATGTFATVNDANTLALNYGGSAFTLGTLLSGTNFWTGGAGDFLWASGGNWSLGHEPNSTEDAQIADLSGTPTISILIGSHTPKSFFFFGDETFSVSGNLSFTNASSIANGTLNISAATVTANAGLTAKNLNLSAGGVVNGTGSLTVTDAFSSTGGSAVNLGGAVSITQAIGNLVANNYIGGSSVSLTASAASILSTGGNILAGAGGMTLSAASNITVQDAQVQSSGTLDATAAGNLSVAANTASSQVTSTGLQTIDVNGISVTVGTTSGFLAAQITSGGGQLITAGASGITMNPGNGVAGTAEINQYGASSAQSLVLNSGGSLTLTGGAGFSSSGVQVYAQGSGGQSITFNGGGNLTVSGGTTFPGNTAKIQSTAGTQTIGNAGTIQVLGGIDGSGNTGSIWSSAGLQSISAINIIVSGNTATGSSNAAEIGSFGATGGQTINATSISLSGGSGGAGAGSGNSAKITSAHTQSITAGSGGLTLTGGDGVNNQALVSQFGPSATQTISSTGSISLTGGGASNGTGNSANITQSGSGLQHVTANAIHITGGGGTTGGTSGAAIQTATGSTASQQLDVGAGGITMQGGTGSAGNNKAGIYLLADFGQPTFTTNATQVVNVTGGSILITGGTNAINSPAGSTNIANIYADAHGAGASQSITVTGSGAISLTGGASGVSNSGGIESNTPYQEVTVGSGGIALNGGGGASGTGNQGRIFAQFATGTQDIGVLGGGSISINGGTGSGGSNVGQILNTGSGAQMITFTAPGSSINITGGTGGISLSGTSGNAALIDAALGSQLITGSILANDPAITVTGGPSGGNTNGSATNLGNNAIIRARVGTQTIDAGAIQVTGGASGVDNSATIQAPTQIIGAASASIQGGGSSGTAAGARIGGIGGATPGPTNLNLTTTGNVTVSGGSVAGASIGVSTAGGFATNITINSGGNVTLNDGTGIGARIGGSTSNLAGGNISVTATGNISLNAANGFGTSIATLGDIDLTAGGSITEAANSRIVADILTATTLNNAGGAISLPGLNNDVAVIDLAARNAANLGDAAGAITYRDAGGFDVLWARTASTVDLTAGQDITIPVGQSIVAPGGVTLTADKMDLQGTINAGGATVILRPLSLNAAIDIGSGTDLQVNTLELSAAEVASVTAGILDIGRSDNSGTGTMTMTAFPVNAQANAGTYRLFAQDINFAGGIASTGAEFARNLELRAANNLSISNSTILLADGAGLKLVADNDSSGAGDLTISNSLNTLGQDRTIVAGTSASNTASMLLQGRNISVSDTAGTTMTVIQRGTATQTMSTPGTLTVQGGAIQADEGTQLVNAQGITVFASGTFGHLSGGTQDITAGSGGITVQGGAGTGNNAGITAHTGSQTIAVNGGNLTVQGGSGSFNNFAEISSSGTAQTITVTGGGIQLNSVANGGAAIRYQGSSTSLLSIAANSIIVSTDSQISTTSGSISLTADNPGPGAAVFLASSSNLSAIGSGNISVSGTAHGAGAGVFLGGNINAAGGNITINGTGGTATDAINVIGVGTPLGSLPSIHAGGTISITGQGGTSTGTGSAQGVSLGNAHVDATGSVLITGFGGVSPTQGAAGVIVSNLSDIGSDANLTITGTGGSAGGSSGGSGVGVILGSGSDTLATGVHVSAMGLLTIAGTGGTATNTGASGVSTNFATIESIGGIHIAGTAGTASGTGNASGTGVALLGSTVQTALAGNIIIDGTGRTSAGTGNSAGVGIADNTLIQTMGIDVPELGGFQVGTGSITITGHGGGQLIGSGATGTGNANGVAIGTVLTVDAGQVKSNTGDITITGFGGLAANGDARGFAARSSTGVAALLETFGGGSISITGTGGTATASGTNTVTGVGFGAATARASGAGMLTLNGTGGTNLAAGGNANGTGISDNSLVTTTGSGTLSITGIGGTSSGGSTHGVAVNPFTTTLGATVAASASLVLNGTVGSNAGSSAINISDSSVGSSGGSVNANATGDMSLTTVNAPATLNAQGNETVNATGTISLSAGSSMSAGATNTALELVASTFVNNAGAGALSTPAGRWLVWSGSPASDTPGGLAFDFKQYAATYGGTTPAQSTGNGLLYSVAPVLGAFSLTGSASRVYDGTTVASLAGAGFSTPSGLLAGDTTGTVTAASATYDDKNVGTGKTVTATGLAVTAINGGKPVYGYQLSSPSASGAIGTITPAALTISAATDSRPYDGTTTSVGTPTVTSGTVYAVGGDSLTGLVQSYASKNVLGVNGSTLNAGYTLNDGNAGGNYTVTLQSAAGTITPAALTISAVTDSRPYDGTTTSVGTPTVTSGTVYTVGGDSLTGLVQSYASKNVLGANGSTLNAGYTLNDGNSGNNYAVTLNSVAGTITPLALAGAVIASSSSTYGSGLAPGAVTFSNVVAGDTVSSAASVNTGALSGAGVPVAGIYTQTASAVLTGGDAGNYSFGGFTSGANYTISKLALTISGIAASNKVYDGNNGATVSVSGAAYTGLLGGDAVAVNATGTFVDKNVGFGKAVNLVSGYSGADLANYIITDQATATADITRLASVTALASGNWSAAGTWSGGAIPDMANVASVVIPVGTTVTFDNTAAALAGAVQVDSINSAGTLAVNSGTLAVAGPVATAGYAQAGGITSAASFTASNSYNQTGGTLHVPGSVGIANSGALTLGNINGGSLVITNTGGAIGQAGGSALVIQGTTNITAGASPITLTQPSNDFIGQVTLSNSGTGNAVSIADVNSISFTSMTLGGDFTVTAGGGAGQTWLHDTTSSGAQTYISDVVLNSTETSNGAFTVTGGLTIGSNSTINTNSGNVAVGGAVVDPGGTTLTINAGTGAIAMTNSGNNLTGALMLAGGNTSITNSSLLTLGASNISGSLTVNSVGITQSGALMIAGAANLQAGSGVITLTDPGNSFLGGVNAVGSSVNIPGFNTPVVPQVVAAAAAVASAVSTATSSTTSNSTNSSSSSTSTSPGSALGFSTPLAPAAAAPVFTIAPTTAPAAAPPASSSATGGSTGGSAASADTGGSTGTSSSGGGTSSSSGGTNSSSTGGSTASADSSSTGTSSSGGGTQTAAADGGGGTSTGGSTGSSSTGGGTSSSSSGDSSSTSSGSSGSGSAQTSSSEGSSSSSSGGSTSDSGSGGGGQRTQQASTSRSGQGQSRTSGASSAAASAIRAQMETNMVQAHAQKMQAVERAVKLLEQNPTIADLKPCAAGGGSDCIAVRPDAPDARTLATPKVSHLPAIEKKVALLIGVSDYEGTIPKLSSPVKDVTEIGKIMKDQLGYEVRTLPNADKATIVRELNRLILESGSNDSVTVMYAGHGHIVEKTNRGYWIPAKASADDPRQWISNQDIAKALENIPAKQIMLVSDSCYSGSLTREAKVDKADVLPTPQAVLGKRSVTVLSSGGEEPVPDQGKNGHSVFAWHFMQTLREVKNVEKGVDVFQRLSDDVKADIPQTPQYGAGMSSGHQVGGDYLFEVRQY